MVRLLVRLGKWLESRFPEKMVVRKADYDMLISSLDKMDEEIDLLRTDINELKQHKDALLDRLAHLEASSVHKGAVQELVGHVKLVKDELVAMKANLGWARPAAANDELQAMLNGEVLNDGQ